MNYWIYAKSDEEKAYIHCYFLLNLIELFRLKLIHCRLFIHV